MICFLMNSELPRQIQLKENLSVIWREAKLWFTMEGEKNLMIFLFKNEQHLKVFHPSFLSIGSALKNCREAPSNL